MLDDAYAIGNGCELHLHLAAHEFVASDVVFQSHPLIAAVGSEPD